MKRRFVLLFAMLVALSPGRATPSVHPRPHLVVVISLDQFPFEYLLRFEPHFGKGGFRRFLDKGAVFANASYKHAMNETGPGHAVILSGSYGNRNGIVMNTWFDRTTRKVVYCVDDPGVTIVGSSGRGRSPRNFVGSTFGDQLRLATGFTSKVISISNKDRAAILMGGRLADAAYWAPDSLFVTSSYYRSMLPDWVNAFNARRKANSYFRKVWRNRLPASAFAELDVDDAEYESGSNGMGTAFPHPIVGDDTTHITQSYFNAFARSPFSVDYLEAFAEAALEGERLGKRGVTDLLCVSFSATDYVGHAYGPHSHEVLEMAVAVDETLARLLGVLDRKIGAGNYVVALTSDHGVDPIPEYILWHRSKAEAGRVSQNAVRSECENALVDRFGAPPEGMKWIVAMMNRSIYLNDSVCAARSVDLPHAARVVAATLKRDPLIAAVMTGEELAGPVSGTPLADRLARSYYPGRSGDVTYAYKPFYFDGEDPAGTTHGAPYEYSAHVPLIIMGGGMRPGWYYAESSPADLAPTLSAIIRVEFPASREGRVLQEALEGKHN
jgi:predicted AlkP superfamily pyrophosphatase or phosphodiesterase